MTRATSDAPGPAGGWCRGDAAPPPPEPLPFDELTRSWEGDRPVVSVRCSTYQHVGFIGAALAGFLAQRTTFPFEVVVIDDASTDGTADVVADAAERYPGVVRAVLRTRNSRALREAGGTPPERPPLHGEFVAPCEGDDHWLDPRKLARQVALLRERPDCASSHHDAVVVADGRVVVPGQLGDRARDLSARELRLGSALPLRTMLFRNDPSLSGPAVERFRRRIWNGDRFLTNRLGLLGGSVFAADILPAVYRRHAGGISTLLREDPVERATVKAESALWSAAYFLDRGDHEVATAQLQRAVRHLVIVDAQEGFDPRLAIAADLIRRALPDTIRRRVRGLIRRPPTAAPGSPADPPGPPRA